VEGPPKYIMSVMAIQSLKCMRRLLCSSVWSCVLLRSVLTVCNAMHPTPDAFDSLRKASHPTMTGGVANDTLTHHHSALEVCMHENFGITFGMISRHNLRHDF